MPFRDRKGTRAALEGAAREQGGAAREHGEAAREHGRKHWGAAKEERFWLLGRPDLAAPYSAAAAPVTYYISNVQPHQALDVKDDFLTPKLVSSIYLLVFSAFQGVLSLKTILIAR